MNRRVAAVTAVVIALLGWHVVARADRQRAETALANATRGLNESRAARDQLQHELDRLVDTLDWVRTDTATAGMLTTRDRDARAQLLASLDEMAADRQKASDALFLTAAALAELRDEIAARGVVIADLQTCVNGVLAAATATEAGDTDGAVAQLKQVTEACNRAQRVALGGGNVVFPFDFPDPFVVWDGSQYYGYATNSAGGAIQLIHSPDLASWDFVGPALRDVPGWAQKGATWAPSVLRRGNHWVLYYAVRNASSGQQCLSAATADGAAGPFVDTSSGPLVCNDDAGGSIDPSPFVAPDGTAYLTWKVEGEVNGGAAELDAQQLRADGLALIGDPGVLLYGAQGWEGHTIEAPSMAATDIGYVLLYSGNSWNSSSYATGAARCDGPLGPCHRTGGPVLTSFLDLVGPGGADMFHDAAGALRVAYHAWIGGKVGYPYARYLHIGRVRTDGGVLSVDG